MASRAPQQRLRLPGLPAGPAEILGRRVAAALFLVFLVTMLVLLDTDGYGDTADGSVSVIDAIYYATVAVTTTGYGDIAPITEQARLITALVVTPIRVTFLILVVGTTVEVLTDRWRDGLREQRWRKRMTDHFIICGYGTKGRAAASALTGQGNDASKIVIVDRSESSISRAQRDGYAVIAGDATRSSVLIDAQIGDARGVVVALDRDDTAVLVTLTARDLNADVPISASAKEEENTSLLTRSGADSVVTADEATGRLLGIAITYPAHVELLEDLLSAGEGLELVEEAYDAGGGVTLGVVRDDVVIPLTEPGLTVAADDRVVRIRAAVTTRMSDRDGPTPRS